MSSDFNFLYILLFISLGTCGLFAYSDCADKCERSPCPAGTKARLFVSGSGLSTCVCEPAGWRAK
jgi:hypothetical protein